MNSKELKPKFLILLLEASSVTSKKVHSQLSALLEEKGVSRNVVLIVNYDLFLVKYADYSIYEGRVPVSYPTEVLSSQLYLGDFVHANDVSVLHTLGITHILDASNEHLSRDICTTLGLKYEQVNVWDLETESIAAYFTAANNFISSALALDGGRVLVHCRAGVSRSASLVLAFLLFSRRQPSLREAISHVIRSRPQVSPNEGFRNQLREYEYQISGQRSVGDDDAFLGTIVTALEAIG
jgi:hypothetical protein